VVGTHPDFIEADRITDDSGCVLRYERTFMRPLLPQGRGRVGARLRFTRADGRSGILPAMRARVRLRSSAHNRTNCLAFCTLMYVGVHLNRGDDDSQRGKGSPSSGPRPGSRG
jgi:hypothetical protein